MNIAEVTEFLRTNHRSVLATQKADGTPQMSPVAHAVDADGRIMISTREPAMKVKHLRERPRAWVCGLPDSFFGKWVQAEGPVEIISLPDAMPLLEEVYRGIAGEHDNWDEYRAAMEKDRRVVIRITIEKAGPTISG
jgi:PPOX class probable F420-dependent enzyme